MASAADADAALVSFGKLDGFYNVGYGLSIANGEREPGWVAAVVEDAGPDGGVEYVGGG